MNETIILRQPGLIDYAESYRAMSGFTTQRGPDSADEIWCLQHPPVYTLGMAANRGHILDAGSIEVLASDRGGQVTYHGPGQLLVYLLLDLRRRKIAIRDYVRLLEQSVIDYLATLGIAGLRLAGAPGVYVAGRKIAALGIRIRRGCAYHGLALNVDMDTRPFLGINPCGYAQLRVTQLADYGSPPTMATVSAALVDHLLRNIVRGPYTVLTKPGLVDLSADCAVP